MGQGNYLRVSTASSGQMSVATGILPPCGACDLPYKAVLPNTVHETHSNEEHLNDRASHVCSFELNMSMRMCSEQ